MEFVFGGGSGINGASIGHGTAGGVASSHSDHLAGALGAHLASHAVAATAGLSHENGPNLYSEPNRTSAVDDIRSVLIYIFTFSLFVSFFLIFPGIRNEKLPTFLCVTTSLIVTSIILISLFGTTWHVGEAPISAAYKAFSRDRIQGELNVKIGLQSVNITLRAYKYYILHATDGPITMDNTPGGFSSSSSSPVSTLMSLMSAPSSGSSSSLSAGAAAASPPPPPPLPPPIAALQDSSKIQARSSVDSGEDQRQQSNLGAGSSFINTNQDDSSQVGGGGGGDIPASASKKASNLAEELLGGRTSDGLTVDTELEVEEVFEARAGGGETPNTWTTRQSPAAAADGKQRDGSAEQNDDQLSSVSRVRKRSAKQQPAVVAANGDHVPKSVSHKQAKLSTGQRGSQNFTRSRRKHKASVVIQQQQNGSSSSSTTSLPAPKFTIIKGVNVDINYNERFYWIEPNQMQQEYHNALERGLPYPILTVVEYLSQDEANFNWSRQYRAAGYYASILLWLALCGSALMFCLHCAAPKYGMYAMQAIGCLLLFTNLTYFSLVPKGEQKLVIPYEGGSLVFRLGLDFWLVLFAGCLSLTVGTIIVIIDNLFPNYIFTTILDVDYDSHHNKYYKTKKVSYERPRHEIITDGRSKIQFKSPSLPPFYVDTSSKATSSAPSIASSVPSTSSTPNSTIRTRIRFRNTIDTNVDDDDGGGGGGAAAAAAGDDKIRGGVGEDVNHKNESRPMNENKNKADNFMSNNRQELSAKFVNDSGKSGSRWILRKQQTTSIFTRTNQIGRHRRGGGALFNNREPFETNTNNQDKPESGFSVFSQNDKSSERLAAPTATTTTNKGGSSVVEMPENVETIGGGKRSSEHHNHNHNHHHHHHQHHSKKIKNNQLEPGEVPINATTTTVGDHGGDRVANDNLSHL